MLNLLKATIKTAISKVGMNFRHRDSQRKLCCNKFVRGTHLRTYPTIVEEPRHQTGLCCLLCPWSLGQVWRLYIMHHVTESYLISEDFMSRFRYRYISESGFSWVCTKMHTPHTLTWRYGRGETISGIQIGQGALILTRVTLCKAILIITQVTRTEQ